MTTHHQYLDAYPIDPTAKALIVGTIHPHNRENFVMDFFYGSQCSIWTILAEAFPDQLTDPVRLSEVRRFLLQNRITLSDTIRTCNRVSNSALDAHLVPIAYNLPLLDQLKHSQITKVFFTSGAGKNCALRTFYIGVLKYKYLPTVVAKSKEGYLPTEIFGRPIQYTVLYSPSTTADRGIKKSKAFKAILDLYQQHNRPVHAYKVDLYRQAFANLITGN